MKNKIDYSPIVAGTMTWGSWEKNFSNKQSVAAIHTCLEAGITTFDHADIYGDYTTEQDFGSAFLESDVSREKVQFISKCGIQMITRQSNSLKHYQYDKKYIIWSAEESLRKLKTDYIDLFLLHRPSPLMNPVEIADAILELKEQGKIKEFGVSNFTSSQIKVIETAVPVKANQVEFSLTANGVMYDGTLDDCLLNNRLAMAWSPLGGYFNIKGEKKQRIKKVLIRLEKKYEATSNALLLAWILKHPTKVYPVIGTTNLERIKDAAQAHTIELELEDWFALLEASQGHEVA